MHQKKDEYTWWDFVCGPSLCCFLFCFPFFTLLRCPPGIGNFQHCNLRNWHLVCLSCHSHSIISLPKWFPLNSQISLAAINLFLSLFQPLMRPSLGLSASWAYYQSVCRVFVTRQLGRKEGRLMATQMRSDSGPVRALRFLWMPEREHPPVSCLAPQSNLQICEYFLCLLQKIEEIVPLLLFDWIATLWFKFTDLWFYWYFW